MKKLFSLKGGLAISVMAAGITPLAGWAEPIHVMSLGDSITKGTSAHNYRAQLSEKTRSSACDIELVGAYQDGLPSVISRSSAIWGVQAAAVDASYIDAWMSDAQPDIVLMMLGVNDVRNGRKPADVIQNLRSIVGKMRAINPSVHVFLARYPNILPDLPDVNTLNQMIPELVAELHTSQSQVTYVDHSVDNYNIDGGADNIADALHPNQNGDAKYANNWFRAMVTQSVCTANPELVNAALHKPVASSPSPYGYGTPFDAVNGTVNDNGWTRPVADGKDQTMEIDLQGIYNLRYLELSHDNRAPAYNTKAYRIDVSSDQESWHLVAELSGNDKPRTTHQIDPVDARYIRLTLKPPFESNSLMVREFRAMGLPVSRP